MAQNPPPGARLSPQGDRGITAALRHDPDANAYAEGLWRLDERTFSNCMAVSKSAVAAYRTSTAVKAAETGRFDPESLLDNCGTVYLTAPPQSQRQYAGIFVGILNRLLACAYWREARGERSAPLLVALDEAANIAPLPELDSLATTAAGSGIQLVTVWHPIASSSPATAVRQATQSPRRIPSSSDYPANVTP